MKPDPLSLVTSTLRRAVDDAGDVDASPPARDEAIARLAQAIARRRGLERRRRVAYVAVAALVLLGAGFAFRRPPVAPVVEGGRVSESGLTVVRDGHESVVAKGERLVDGAELRTPSGGEAHLEFERGSQLAVGGSSRLRLVEQAQHKHFALLEGNVRAKVAKLTSNESFVVTTSDTEVEVRGTEFSVSVVLPDPSCGGGSPTRVDVREGVVVVRHAGTEQRVAAGERWPRCETPEVAPSSSVVTTKPVRTVPRPERIEVTAAPASAAPAVEASHLAEQNDLFQEALRRKRSGDAAGALDALDRLRAKYGDGPLAENAEVERFRILSGTDRVRAASVARDYVRLYPHGFARAEAEALAGP